MEYLYSRQIGVLGKCTMTHISNLATIIIGCDTIGVETAKSLILMGIKKIYLYDNSVYSKKHYGRLLFKPTKKVKLSILCKQFLENLDTRSEIEIVHKKLDISQLVKNKKIQCLVMTDLELGIKNIESICMANNIPFIFGYNSEMLGYVFSNFNKWDIVDGDGEPCFRKHTLGTVIKNNLVELTFESTNIPNSKHFKLSSGKKTYIGTVEKYHIENNGVVKNLKASIKLDKKLQKILENNANIMFSEIKKKQTIKHKSFIKNIKTNGYSYIDAESSFNRNDELYSAYTSYLYSNNPSKYPEAHYNKKDYKFYILGSIIGGILAQEVIKTSHKYTPIDQDIFFNFQKLIGKEFYKSGNKFSDLCGLFDKEILMKFKKIKAFMIGCGALGCEISKNLGMMGFGQNKKASLSITDMDTIELSNLTRQFLFQNKDIGKNKSAIVKDKLHKYCPDLNINCYNSKVSDNNEQIFNYNFWKNKDIIINALDNVVARKYVDKKCFIFKKPLFESGTLGVKGNVQVIIPKKTATYSEIQDPPEKGIPMCTIRNFPNNIEHCVEWGLGIFDKIFNTGISDYSLFILNRKQLFDEIDLMDNETNKQARYALIYYLYNYYNKKTYRSLVQLGNYIYTTNYYNIINELLETHNEESFWVGNKLKPKLLAPKDILDSKYYYNILNLLDPLNISIIKSSKLRIKTSTIDYQTYLKSVHSSNKDASYVKPSKNNIYDKDISSHLEIMASIVNLRAKCYNIEESDTVTIQLLSGKIIPALSTTTSVVSAFVVLDIIKYLTGINKFSETNINIGINQYTRYKAFKPMVTHNNMFHPDYNMKIKTIPRSFTTWDRIHIDGKGCMVKTNKDLYNYLKDKFELENIDMITSGNFIIYSCLSNKEIRLTELYKYYRKLKNHKVSIKEPLILDVLSFDTNRIPILLPPVVYTLV